MYKHILMGAALAFGLTACTEDFTDWSNPQHNNPEEAKTIAINVTNVDAINFAELDGVDSVQLFTSSVTATDAPALTYQVLLAAEGDATKTASVTANANCKVAVTDLRLAVESLYGKAPVLRTMPAEVTSYATVGIETFKYVGKTQVQVTLVAPEIEEAYYLVGDGLGWDYAGAIAHKFSHSGGNVYDNPVFTLTVPAPTNEDGTRKDFYFKLVPQSAVAGGDLNWDKVMGTAADTEDVRAEETVKTGGKAFKQSADDKAKFYSITINMMDYKMTVAPLSFSEFVYVPGNHQDWSPESAPALRSPNFDGVYTGFVNLNGDFKLTKERNWSNGEYNHNDFFTYTDNFKSGEGSNINSTEGLFYLEANVANKALKATPITKVGVVGNFNGWGNDAVLTYNAAEDCYQGQVVLDGGAFKFRFNGEWSLNLGGSIDNLTQNGADITAEAGTYTVKLYLSRAKNNNIYCTLTK